ncbi:hypothetical protein Pst134EA_002865 [Puccinia striiformis f. sp. tritici]|uniref:Uncharacterized protein n=1 Tax=Puccinia striiformis f. sp. tritici PST-78 TaxID=1165861 RepID=A0A0L0VUD9_9BASI|nr:hypothetical protein Pst134EA_002865 [Puccinia striiformis f. sp. tritici]KAI9618196.1 hypothetical protein H4Q26_012544 [Puccinia striiformis f. sp. tritici PST-130]KNF02899.1 hypothetical protein PSTG_03847 [Puccinia striiformis f. sp. tritici PST-78]KAH9464427.1 hypothetical protein Pst134EB_003956 [Puccinia striiformis f. sp. tritici]KAH9472249.1 hypothetical protein Pst134EA_002865 [Puccinia striiformis f. sp. tritici]KAI9628059.1 hypothetical protein KEM48_011838 [Puccinia striiformis
MSFRASFYSFPFIIEVFVILKLAFIHCLVVSAGAGTPASDISSSSNQFGRLVDTRRPGESRSPRYWVSINSDMVDPWTRSGTTDPILTSIIHKAAAAESSTSASSSKRRKVFDNRFVSEGQRVPERPDSPRRKVKTGQVSFPMEVDEGLAFREGHKTYRPAQEEVDAGAKEIQRGLSEAFGGKKELISEIENSGVFRVTKRLLDLMMYHDLDDSIITEEDDNVIQEAFVRHLPSDLDLSRRRVFWDHLDQGKRPEYHLQDAPPETFASILQCYQNMINRKLLRILSEGGSGTLGPNGRRVLDIANQYHRFLDQINKALDSKPTSFIDQLLTYQPKK